MFYFQENPFPLYFSEFKSPVCPLLRRPRESSMTPTHIRQSNINHIARTQEDDLSIASCYKCKYESHTTSFLSIILEENSEWQFFRVFSLSLHPTTFNDKWLLIFFVEQSFLESSTQDFRRIVCQVIPRKRARITDVFCFSFFFFPYGILAKRRSVFSTSGRRREIADVTTKVASRHVARATYLFGHVLIQHARPLSVHATMLDTEPTNPIRLSAFISQILSYGTVLIRVLK